MPETRKDKAIRVLHTIIGLDPDSNLEKALNENTLLDTRTWFGLTEEDMDSLTYTDSGTEKTLRKGDTMPLKAFLALVDLRKQQPSIQINFDGSTLTGQEFEDFYSSTEFRRIRIATTPTASRSGAAPPMTTAEANLLAFRKGVRRDPSLFPVMKEDSQWDSWNRSVIAAARAQAVDKVLDPSYTPTVQAEVSLFEEQKKFMFQVFERCLQSDRGKAIVRKHEANFNAQLVYGEIKDHCSKSIKASLQSGTLLKYITTAKAGDGTWKSGFAAFILHWEEQVRQYQSLVPGGTIHFADPIKLQILQNAVSDVPRLAMVKQQADQISSSNGKVLTYDEYVALLYACAQQIDAQSKVDKPRRNVFVSDTMTTQDDGMYSIDTPVNTILANAVSSNQAHMPWEAWSKLSPKDKQIWDQLSDETKKIILGRLSGPKPPPKPPPFKPKSKPFTRKVNLHDVLSACQHMFEEHDVGDITHDVTGSEDQHIAEDPDDIFQDASDSAEDDHHPGILAYMSQMQPKEEVSPAQLARMMSAAVRNHAKKPTPSGKTPSKAPSRKVNMCKLNYVETNSAVYRVSQGITIQGESTGTLVDGGSNGGIAGAEMRVIEIYGNGRTVDVEGIDRHRISNVKLGTAGAVVKTQAGPVIAVCHNYALIGRGTTIHSVGQMRAYDHVVDDTPLKVGGKQRITSREGYVLPLNVRRGLPYLTMRPFTDEEWENLPHLIMTSEEEWDPTMLDFELDEDEEWFDTVEALDQYPYKGIFDQRGDMQCQVMSHDVITCKPVDKVYVVNHRGIVRHNEPDYEELRPRFAWLPTDIIRETFDKTSQYARISMSEVLKKRYKSPNPALNIHRRNEPVATDTIFSDVPAVDDGSTCAQLFVGTESLVTDVYGMKSEKQFIHTLEDNIRERGAMKQLLSDSAAVEISKTVLDLLRTLFIPSWQSEPHQQHQNPAERRIQDVKRIANTILDRTGSPAYTWLLALMYVCYVLNSTFNRTVNNVPMTIVTGQTHDISPLLQFHWWEPVYYKVAEDKPTYPSESREKRGRFVGIAQNVGHAMTFKILTDDTRKVITRSVIRSAATDKAPNLRLDPLDGESVKEFIKSRKISKMSSENDDQASPSSEGEPPPTSNAPLIDITDLVGRTFLINQDDGERHRARIVDVISDHEDMVEQDPERIKFLCSVGEKEKEELIAYNEILDYLQRQEQGETVWKFRRITAHEGPLNKHDASYKGSSYNIMVEWENGEITSEPLNVIASDDPVTCAIYARENNLLDLPGWKRFKSIARREGKFLRMVNQAKLRSFRHSKKYKYGFEVARDYQDALRIDKLNGNSRWAESVQTELDSIKSYDTFKDNGYKVPAGYKPCRVHFVFDVKHDGRHKARLVANGALTEAPLESVYSGVVSLRGIRVLAFLSELNNMELWATDIGNAYLEAETKEKLYIVAGPEFGELQGHILIFQKALYGLKTSGKRWHERLADVLTEIGFKPCKAEPDIWLRKRGDKYEYVGVYVDDLAIVSKYPKEITDLLVNKYGFKLKGTGPIAFHLGCDFIRDEDGTLCMKPTKYIAKVMDNYKLLFGTSPPHNISSPLEKGDHPELDTSNLLEEDKVKVYQLQWAVSLARMDIATAVMTMSSFRAAPRVGHLERTKRICGYISKMRHGCIRFRTEEPDYSSYGIPVFDWMNTVYGNVREEIPDDAPEPLGNFVTTTHYVDANLMHDMLSGKSVTGILDFLNQTPIDWFSKKQPTVETATFGSEFVAARIATERVAELRLYLRYLGVPIREQSWMFGDNRTVVNQSTMPDASLHKRHYLLSYHKVRQAVASGMIVFIHIDGRLNPADILSKHWGYQQVWKDSLKPLLFWAGDTMESLEDAAKC